MKFMIMKKILTLFSLLFLLTLISCQSRIVGDSITGEVVKGVNYGTPDYGIEKQQRQGDTFVTLKEFHITADNQFRPNYLVVNEGDAVRLIIYASTSNYGFVLPEYGINEFLEEDNYKTIEFVADTPGTFSFWSNVYSGPETPYMNGRFIVVESEE